MPGRFEGMSGAERELSEAFSPKKHGKGAGCLLPLAEGMAFRRKAQRIAGSSYWMCVQNDTRKNVRSLAADIGYDDEALRIFLKKGIQPQIPRKRNAEKTGAANARKRTTISSRTDFLMAAKKVLAARPAVRQERLPDCFDAFISLALCFVWVQRLVG